MAFYSALGKRPIHVRQELAGHVVNRLQAALWREAYSLVERGVATVAEVDAAITNGPGLRWAVVGPFAGQHLSGGAGGIAHTLEHLGPPMVAWWDDLASARRGRRSWCNAGRRADGRRNGRPTTVGARRRPGPARPGDPRREDRRDLHLPRLQKAPT